MRSPRLLLPLVFLALSACTNLKPVREYALESAKFSAYTGLTKHYRDTYYRERPYLDPEGDKVEKLTDAKRRAAYGDLLKLNKALSTYMKTLAQLAGEDTYVLSKELDALSGTLQEHLELGIDADQVQACTSLVQITARWAATARQERAVREMVQQGDPHVQKLLAGMGHLVRLYRKTHLNERAQVLGVFEAQLPFTEKPQDALLNRLARAHVQSKTEEYDAAEKRFVQVEKALAAMATGHRTLKEHLSDLSKEELKASLKQAAQDIQEIRENLPTLQE